MVESSACSEKTNNEVEGTLALIGSFVSQSKLDQVSKAIFGRPTQDMWSSRLFVKLLSLSPEEHVL